MHHFFVSPDQISEKQIVITGSDVNHIRNVLRMREGDELRVCTGEDDRDFRCRIRAFAGQGDDREAPAAGTARRSGAVRTGSGQVLLDILWVEHTQAELPCRITLFQGLPKSDKMESIVQKNVELGVFSIVPVVMDRCVMKIREGKAEGKVQRWSAIAESAAKQSKRMRIPSVEMICSFEEALAKAGTMDHILFPYELAENMTHTRQVLGSISPGQSVAVFIGPEGGFEQEEAAALEAAGAHVITLGRRILRTETAGMALLAMLNYVLEE